MFVSRPQKFYCSYNQLICSCSYVYVVIMFCVTCVHPGPICALQVGFYPAQTNHLNTYQVVLASDKRRTFAFIRYASLNWIQADASRSPAAFVGAGTDG